MAGKRKIIRIEDITRPKSDFLQRRNLGYEAHRAIMAGRELEIPLKDRLRHDAKRRNTCAVCGDQSTKMLFLKTRVAGVIQRERYCSSCFERLVDVDKMVIREFDNSYLDKIQIKPSQGGSGRSIEDWQRDPNYKRWTHIK